MQKTLKCYFKVQKRPKEAQDKWKSNPYSWMSKLNELIYKFKMTSLNKKRQAVHWRKDSFFKEQGWESNKPYVLFHTLCKNKFQMDCKCKCEREKYKVSKFKANTS